MKGMRSVVLHVSVQTRFNIIKIVMEGVFQEGIMQATTGIVMGHAYQTGSHVIDSALMVMSDVAMNVYHQTKCSSIRIAMENALEFK